jgi:hypothetical protein
MIPIVSFTRWQRFALLSLVCVVVGGVSLHLTFGHYGFNAFMLRGGSRWTTMPPDSPLLPPAIRMALRDPMPPARAGGLTWGKIADGFKVGELSVLAAGEEVDRLLLARIDPARFRFVVRSAPAGDKSAEHWMAEPGTLMVMNGSYYARDGRPDTPVLCPTNTTTAAVGDSGRPGIRAASPSDTGHRPEMVPAVIPAPPR